MTSVLESIRRLFTPVEPISPGLYHYQAPPEDPRNYRLHLRVNQDGRGMLVVNAATVLHLNETATEYAYFFVKNASIDKVTRYMAARYQVRGEQAALDYHDLAERILTLIETPDLDPVTFLDFERRTPYSGKLSAPYRLDCALTYRLPEGADPDLAPTKRVDRELDTGEWKTILDKAWQAGIPHVVFTGGEPTLRGDLPELIAHAEANGQVSGLLTGGLQLADQSYLDKLLKTGLDHVLFLLHMDDTVAWQAMQNALAGDIFTAVHITLTEDNRKTVPVMIGKLASLGVHSISLSASQAELDQDLFAARELVANHNLALVWDLPVPYSDHHPVALEVSTAEVPQGAGRAWLYVEPDGDVLPAQGVPQILGNFLRDPWDQIWRPE